MSRVVGADDAPGATAYDAAAMIITIDGPAAVGKTTVASTVARRLNLPLLPTGSMYRAVGLEADRSHAALDDVHRLTHLAQHCRIRFDFASLPPRLFLNGQDVTPLLNRSGVDEAASAVAVIPEVRRLLVEQQRQIAAELGSLVAEGRDQGSVVFPEAACKFFVTASPRERARRRVRQLREKGLPADLEQILQQIVERDHRDSTRPVGALVKPDDAIELKTDELTEEQVVQRILDAVEAAKAR